MHDFLLIPVVHGALIGLGPAIGIDLVIFKSSNSWSDFAAKFDLSTASYRWVQGLLFGALTAGGLSAVFGL